MPKLKMVRKNVRKDWAMYVYIAGDNNLSDAGLIDIMEMETAGASKDVHVAVQIDTEGEHAGSQRYEISEPDFEEHSHRIVIQRLPEQNTGDPRYLADFMTWAADRYPADKRLLVVWNHGAGFMHTPTRDIGYDDSSRGDALTMGELRWSLEQAGFGSGASGKLAILGFDACLMNMLEVAYEFMGLADFVVGSQQTEPGDGWPYDQVLRGMKGHESPTEVAGHIVKTYIESYKKTGTRDVTQSALQLTAFPALGKAVDALGAALLGSLPARRDSMIAARVTTQSYAEPTYVDLIDLANNLDRKLQDPKVSSACQAIRESAEQAVLLNKVFGDSVGRSAGLSIWFPLLKSDYLERRTEYVALRYTRDFPKWSRFLDTLLMD